MPFRFLADVAIADVAFEADAATVDGLFEAAADALTEVMVDRGTVEPRVERELSVRSENLERLLYDFLTELIVIKDVDSLLFKDFRVQVEEGGVAMRCSMRGETIDRERHLLRNDVKAVTMHLFRIVNSDGGWTATVVLDI